MAHVAARVGLHPVYLAKMFSGTYGIGPYAYWAAGRIETARELLRSGIGPTELSHRLGFADQSHFTRTFRRLVGVAPGQYRDALHSRSSHGRVDRLLTLS
jgi:AraC-like DNA-binding protein